MWYIVPGGKGGREGVEGEWRGRRGGGEEVCD